MIDENIKWNLKLIKINKLKIFINLQAKYAILRLKFICLEKDHL